MHNSPVTLIGQETLRSAGRKNAPLRKGLESWAAVVKQARWNNLIDVRKQYPSADGVKAQNAMTTVLNIKGNEYRLITVIDYSIQSVIACEVLTHAQYSKNNWKTRH